MNIQEENLKDKEEKEEKKTWAEKYASSEHADKWLALFSFAESSFFPLPPSTLMVAIMSVKERHKRWIYYATLTTITSVLGGLFGYLIGSIFYETLGQGIVSAYNLSEDLGKVRLMFNDNAFLAILIAAFTPIPYKVFTLAGGFFGINIFIFTIASLIGRGLRFFIVAYLMSLLGERVSKKVMKRINLFAFIVAIIIIVYFFYKIAVVATSF